jgi:starch phosphorylase
MPQFLGKVIFLENYDMDLAKRLISGVDIWLNTPTRPLEASGTSGEKAQMNGVLNFSVLDGWWYEGYVPGAGWALTDKRTYENQAHQDQLDAATIYQMLESEIIPMYYARNAQGFSPAWLQAIKKSVTEITPRFTTKRMMDDYFDRFYCKLAKRHATLAANNYELAKQIVAWKENVVNHWDEITVVSSNIEEVLAANPMVGENYKLEVILDTKGLGDKGIGVELVVTRSSLHNNDKLYHVQEFDLKKAVGSILHFETVYQANYAGALKFGLRMFPKNDLLPHRMDFCYVRWL